MSQEKSSLSYFLTPAGAVIALIAFFLPWVKLSCAGQIQNLTGFQMAKGDNWYWAVLACAAAILFVFFYLRSRTDLGKVKKLTVAAAMGGLGILLYKYYDFKTSMDSMESFTGSSGWQASSGSQDLQLTLQIGAYACLAGFILAGLGGLFMRTEESPKLVMNPQPSTVLRGTASRSGTGKVSSAAKKETQECTFCINGLPPGFISCPECGAQKPKVSS